MKKEVKHRPTDQYMQRPVPISCDEPINIVDKQAQQSDMGLSTNIKVAVSNRVKSAKPTKPSTTKVQSSKYESQNLHSLNTRNATGNHTRTTQAQTITPGKLTRSKGKELRKMDSQAQVGMLSHINLRGNSSRRRALHESSFARGPSGKRDTTYGTLIQKKFETRAGHRGSQQAGSGSIYQQHLYKGSNFSQLSKQKRIMSSVAGNQPLDALHGGSQPYIRDFSANNTVAASGATRSYVNTTMLKVKKPAREYMGFNSNSIKSSFKSDPSGPGKIFSNSISSECLNAQRIAWPERLKSTKQGNLNNMMLGSGEQDLRASNQPFVIETGDRVLTQQDVLQQSHAFANYTNHQYSPVHISHQEKYYQVTRQGGNKRMRRSTFYGAANAATDNKHLSRRAQLRRKQGYSKDDRKLVSKINSTSTHAIQSNEGLPISPIQTAEPMVERVLSGNLERGSHGLATTSPDFRSAMSNQNGSKLSGVAIVQQEYGVDKGKHYLTLMDVNNETLQGNSNQLPNPTNNNTTQLASMSSPKNNNRFVSSTETPMSDNNTTALIKLAAHASEGDTDTQNFYVQDPEGLATSNLRSEREPHSPSEGLTNIQDGGTHVTSTKMGPLLMSSPINQIPPPHYNMASHSGDNVNNFAESPDLDRAKGDSRLHGVAKPIRASIVYLRDQNGNYYQVEEELFMRLQLDEMQKTVHQVTSSELQDLHIVNQAAGEAVLKQPRHDKVHHQKKASLVVNLTKPGGKASPSLKNGANTVRRDSAAVYPNSQGSASTPMQIYPGYQSNAVHINGMKYEAVQLQDIPKSAQVLGANPEFLQIVRSSNTSLGGSQPMTHISQLHLSGGAPVMQSQGTNVDKGLEDGKDAEVRTLVDNFKSEHNQFVKCMRNFSAKDTSDKVLAQTFDHSRGNPNPTSNYLNHPSLGLSFNQHSATSTEMQGSFSPVYRPTLEAKQRSSPLMVIDGMQHGQLAPYMVPPPHMQLPLGQDDFTLEEQQQRAQYPLTPTQALFNAFLHNPHSVAAAAHTDEFPSSLNNPSEGLPAPHVTSNPMLHQSNTEQHSRLLSPKTASLASSKGRSSSQEAARSRGISQNFPPQSLLNRNLDQGRIEKAFVSPTNYKTGVSFPTKSEERRFHQHYDQILKLRHVLLTDKDRAKTYTKSVLAAYFSAEEIQRFSELGILNFQNTVRLMSRGPTDLDVREFILNAVSGANRLPVGSLGEQKQRSNVGSLPPDHHSSLSNYICNFEVDNGNVTSLGLNSGKRLLQQQQHDRSKKSLYPPSHDLKQVVSPSISSGQQASVQAGGGPLLLQQKSALRQSINLSKSHTVASIEGGKPQQPLQPRGQASADSLHQQHGQTFSPGEYGKLGTATDPTSRMMNSINLGHQDQQLPMYRLDDVQNHDLRPGMALSKSPTIKLDIRKQSNTQCKKLLKLQRQEALSQMQSGAKDIKPRKGQTCTRYPDSVERQIYYNPFQDGKEVFVKRGDIPGLEPIWLEDKGEARYKVYDFLNQQNLRVVKEIEPRTCDEMSKDMNRDRTLLVNEINNNNPKIRDIKSKYTKEGIMRRNGMLLEHIIYDRFHKLESAFNYFQTPVNMTELRNTYRPNVVWPVRLQSARRYTPEDASQSLSGPDQEALFRENLAALQPKRPQRSHSQASCDFK